MNSQHLVSLLSNAPLTPDWATTCVLSAYDYILWGPDALLIRSNTLNTLLYARNAIARDRVYPVGDRRHREGT